MMNILVVGVNVLSFQCGYVKRMKSFEGLFCMRSKYKIFIYNFHCPLDILAALIIKSFQRVGLLSLIQFSARSSNVLCKLVIS